MATYYADFDLTTGNNDGTDATNAWQTFADAIAGSNGTVPAAGDTVLCRGTDTLSATVTINISGSYAGGFIKFIGVDSSWANVGGSTRAIIDANNGAYSAITLSGAAYLWLENFELKNAGSSGTASCGIFASVGSYYGVYKNIYAHNNYGDGVDGNLLLDYSLFIQCLFTNNAANGIRDAQYCNVVSCRSHSNTYRGFSGYQTFFNGCVAHDNTREGFSLYISTAANIVAHANGGTTYAGISTSHQIPVGMRSTDNYIGIDTGASIRRSILGYYGDNNTVDSSGNFDAIYIGGVSSVTLDGADTDFGYVDSANDDYNLASSASIRRVEVPLP